MKSKKILSLLLSLCILSVSTAITTSNVKAVNNTKNEPKTTTRTMIAGIVTVTAPSGAYIRTGAGTNYSISGSAAYQTELQFTGDTAYDYNGVKWYNVFYGGGRGWISSQVSTLG